MGRRGADVICSLDSAGEVPPAARWGYGIMDPDAENREFEGTDDVCTPSTHTLPES